MAAPSPRVKEGAPVAAAAAAPSPRAAEGAPVAVAAAARAPTTATAGVVEVRSGDTLWDLAATHLGDPLRWPLLHEANRGIVGNPDLIFPGQSLRIPAG